MALRIHKPENPNKPVSKDNPILATKVTKIGDWYHCRLYWNFGDGYRVVEEQACNLKSDIGVCFRDMLRWFDKLGGNSKHADRARHRPGDKPQRMEVKRPAGGTIKVIHPPFRLDTVFTTL